MKTELRRNQTVIRFWETPGKPKEHKIPKGENPEEYLKKWLAAYQSAAAPAPFYDALRAELGNYDRRNTKETYNVALNLAARWNPSGVWSPKKTSEFVKYLHANGYTKKSITTYLAGLRSLFEWAATHGELEGANPFRCKFRLPDNPPTRFEPLTDLELEALKVELKEDSEALNLVAIVEFAFIRPGEIEQLSAADFNAQNQTVHVPAAVAKNRTARTIHYPTAKRLRKPTEPVAKIRGRIKKAMKKAGIKTGRGGSSLYSVKHTSARRLYIASGFNLSTVKAQAGHKSVSSTEKYTDRLKTKPMAGLIEEGW